MTIEKDLKTLSEAAIDIAESLQQISMLLESPAVDTLNVTQAAHQTMTNLSTKVDVSPVHILTQKGTVKPSVITIESLHSLARQVNEMKGGDGKFIMSTLAMYGVEGIKQLTPEDYEDFKRVLDTA